MGRDHDNKAPVHVASPSSKHSLDQWRKAYGVMVASTRNHVIHQAPYLITPFSPLIEVGAVPLPVAHSLCSISFLSKDRLGQIQEQYRDPATESSSSPANLGSAASRVDACLAQYINMNHMKFAHGSSPWVSSLSSREFVTSKVSYHTFLKRSFGMRKRHLLAQPRRFVIN
jgi:hypothetical protein